MIDKSMRWQIGVAAGALSLLIVLGLCMPMWMGINTLRSEIDAAEERLGIARGRTDGLARLAREVNRLREEVAATSRVIPSEPDLAAVLRQLSVESQQQQLQPDGMSTGDPVHSDDWFAVPVGVVLTGQSRDVFAFIDQVEQMPRMIQVDAYTMVAEPEHNGRVEAALKLTTFYAPDDLPGAPQ